MSACQGSRYIAKAPFLFPPPWSTYLQIKDYELCQLCISLVASLALLVACLAPLKLPLFKLFTLQAMCCFIFIYFFLSQSVLKEIWKCAEDRQVLHARCMWLMSLPTICPGRCATQDHGNLYCSRLSHQLPKITCSLCHSGIRIATVGEAVKKCSGKLSL